MTNRKTSSMLFDDTLRRLEVIADKTRECNQQSREFDFLVNEYNQIIEEELPNLIFEYPIPNECLIEDEFLHEDYLEFKTRLESDGPMTLSKYIKNLEIEVIALVRIRSVKRFGRKIKANVIKLIKGNIDNSLSFNVPDDLRPSPWFQKGEECLVFLAPDTTCKEGLSAHANLSRMPIVLMNGAKYVKSYGVNRGFWQEIPYKEVGNEANVTLVLYRDIEELLIAIQSKFDA